MESCILSITYTEAGTHTWPLLLKALAMKRRLLADSPHKTVEVADTAKVLAFATGNKPAFVNKYICTNFHRQPKSATTNSSHCNYSSKQGLGLVKS